MKVFSSILLAVVLVVASLCFFALTEAVPLRHVKHQQVTYDNGAVSNPKGYGYAPGYVKGKRPDASHIINPLPKYTDEIPETWNWGNISGTGLSITSENINQHIPKYCGSCWSCATSGSLAGRIAIRRLNAYPYVRLSVQNLIYCIPNGCGGGDPIDVYRWIHSNPNNGWGIPDETCLQYAAVGTGQQCSAYHTCQNCAPLPGGQSNCTTITDYFKFGIEEYGTVIGIDNMKAEIYERGPIQCLVDAGPIWDWGFNVSTRDQIFTAGKGQTSIDHAIEVIGWGKGETVDGRIVPYWIVKNSWGTFWGEKGFFRLEMGQNQLGIESNPCAWATPTMPKSWENPRYTPGWWKKM